MNKKHIGLLVVFMMVSLLFSGCERPASVSPTVAPTATQSEIPFPVATQPQIMADILNQTQTAMAMNTPTSGSFPVVTSTPAFVFNTPSAETTTPSASITPAVGGLSTAVILQTSTPAVVATVAPTKINYPTPTPGRPATYTIQSGEFLWCLARRFNVNVTDLLNLNGMNSYSQPGIGTTIKIPTTGSFDGTRALKPHPTTYTVVAGDTIGKIACSFGDADPNTIFAANGLAVGSVITVGQVLQIP